MIIPILGGKFRLSEVDNANLPRDFTEMGDFVFFYECIIKWAVSIFFILTNGLHKHITHIKLRI